MKYSAIYKTPRAHEVELPRPGDIAEIRRSHCKQESGLLIQVMGKPHKAYVNCADCGLAIVEDIVEIFCDHEEWKRTPGPWFYPISWLKRLDPCDPLEYARIKLSAYRWIMPTQEQIKAANR